MIDNKKLIRSSLWLTASQISGTLISFLISIIIIKSLDVNAYADYGIIISYSMGLTMISYLGIPNIIQRYLPEKFVDKAYGDILSILTTGFYLRTVTIFVFLTISIGVILLFNLRPAENLTLLAAVIFVYVVGRSFFVIIEEGFNALKKQDNLFVLKTLTGLAKLISILLILFYHKLNVYYILIIFGAYELLGSVVAILYLAKKFDVSIKPVGFSIYKFTKTHIRFGFFNYLSQLQHFVLSHSFEIIIISLILSKNLVAEYTFSVTISTIMISLIPISAVVKGIYPLLIEKYYQTKSHSLLTDLLNEFISFIVIVYSLLTVFVIINIKPIIRLLGKNEYLNTDYVIIILFLLGLISVVSTPLKIGLIILEDAKSLFKANFSFFPVIVLLPVAVHYFGINGVLSVAFLSLASIIILRIIFLQKDLNGKLFNIKIYKVISVLFIAVLLSFFVKYFFDSELMKFLSSILLIVMLLYSYGKLNLIPPMLNDFLTYFKIRTVE